MSPSEWFEEKMADPKFREMNDHLHETILGKILSATAQLVIMGTFGIVAGAFAWQMTSGILRTILDVAPFVGKGAVVLLLLLVACLLQLFKAVRRDYYGAVEIGFAAVAGWKALGGSGIELAGRNIDAIAVVGSTYLMVRGFENMLAGRNIDLLHALRRRVRRHVRTDSTAQV